MTPSIRLLAATAALAAGLGGGCSTKPERTSHRAGEESPATGPVKATVVVDQSTGVAFATLSGGADQDEEMTVQIGEGRGLSILLLAGTFPAGTTLKFEPARTDGWFAIQASVAPLKQFLLTLDAAKLEVIYHAEGVDKHTWASLAGPSSGSGSLGLTLSLGTFSVGDTSATRLSAFAYGIFGASEPAPANDDACATEQDAVDAAQAAVDAKEAERTNILNDKVAKEGEAASKLSQLKGLTVDVGGASECSDTRYGRFEPPKLFYTEATSSCSSTATQTHRYRDHQTYLSLEPLSPPLNVDMTAYPTCWASSVSAAMTTCDGLLDDWIAAKAEVAALQTKLSEADSAIEQLQSALAAVNDSLRLCRNLNTTPPPPPAEPEQPVTLPSELCQQAGGLFTPAVADGTDGQCTIGGHVVDPTTPGMVDAVNQCSTMPSEEYADCLLSLGFQSLDPAPPSDPNPPVVEPLPRDPMAEAAALCVAAGGTVQLDGSCVLNPQPPLVVSSPQPVPPPPPFPEITFDDARVKVLPTVAP